MAKTLTINCEKMAGWQRVSLAFHRAARGKTNHHAVKHALQNPEYTISKVSSALAKGKLPEGSFHSFEIFDPKQRIIHAAPFLDRIAHHAIVLDLEPVFERVLLPSVFACRINKGVHKAIAYAQKQSRRFKWVAHIDIKHFFPNIDKKILKKQIRKRFRGNGLQLLDAVIDAYQPSSEKGLPIGSLTSQHFANHYLNEIDRWSLAQSGIYAHCRYMDDFLFWSNNKEDLLRFIESLELKLEQSLKLVIKLPIIQRTKQDLLFCGIKIRPFKLQASSRRKHRYKLARQKWENYWLNEKITDQQLQQAYASTLAILLPANEKKFRENDLLKRACADV